MGGGWGVGVEKSKGKRGNKRGMREEQVWRTERGLGRGQVGWGELEAVD